MKILVLLILTLVSSNIIGQIDTLQCRYPFYESADSLVKYVIKDIYRYKTQGKVETEFQSDKFKKHFYDSTLPVNYDSIFHTCIDYLKEKIGKELLCENIDLYINSFSTSKNKTDFKLSFGFTYPNLIRDKPIKIGTFTSYNERTNFNFKYYVSQIGKAYIQYPQNVPDCKNKEDCGIIITRKIAMERLERWGLIKENDKVTMKVDGINWNISLSNNGWSSSRHLSINIQTGQFSNFYELQRID